MSYKIPSMRDIQEISKNGYDVISTFSGMGGSSLGMRMAGFDVKVALEFIPEAAKTYRSNNPNTPVIEADIRDINGNDLLNISKLEKGKVHIVEGSPPCLLAGQPIITNNGYIDIDKIKKGNLVYTHMGRYKEVTEIMQREYSGKIYSIKINGMQEELKITEEHPVFICKNRRRDNREYLWIAAKDLHVGDNIVHNLGKFEDDRDYYDIKLAEFLGNFLLFGIVDSHNRIIFNTENNPKVEKSILDCAEKLGLDFKEYIFNNIKYLSSCNNRYLKYIHICKKFDIRDRCIPEEIINSSIAFLKEFVKPLIYGNKNKNETMFFRANNPCKVFFGYQRILLKLNCFSNIYKCISKDTSFSYYVLSINQKELDRIGIDKTSVWFKDNNHVFLKIDKITIGEFTGTVYNLEVSNDNSYCNHLITLHNCSDFSSQHFSSSGKEMGKVKTYSSTKQRVDDLFFEYTRIIGDIEPYIFLAENVESIFDDDKQPYLDSFIEALENAGYYGYNVSVKPIDFSMLGVPQQRVRAIFMGVRKDLEIYPTFPYYNKDIVTTKDAIEDLLNSSPDMEMTELEKKYARIIPVGAGTEYIDMLRDKYGLKIMKFNHRRDTWNIPHPTLVQNTRHIHPMKNRWLTVAEAKRLHTIPDDFILTGTPAQQYERIGRAVPTLGMYHIAKCIKDNILDKLREKGKI